MRCVEKNLDERDPLKGLFQSIGEVAERSFTYNAAGSATNGNRSGTATTKCDLRGDAGTTLREYVWLGDMPVAVLDGSTSPANPTLLWVHADHLNRPELMTNAARAVVWKAIYEPFGAVHSITGPRSLDLRFPGQWFQLETGLHYNWWRHYDPTTGRYTRVDPPPVSTPDVGPSLYSYAGSSPLVSFDPDGRQISKLRPRPLPNINPVPPTPTFPDIGRPRKPWWWDPFIEVMKVCLKGATGFSGDRGRDADCEQEWREAEEICERELSKPTHMRDKRITGGYSNIGMCARGLVSERCGGNSVSNK